MSANEYDVVIVGCGPAGCTLARYLSPKLKVALIDRVSVPRDKACGGVLVPEAHGFFTNDQIPDSVFESPKLLGIKYIDWDNRIEFQEGQTRLWNVDRGSFDYWLLGLVRERLIFLPEHRFVGYKSTNNGIVVTIEQNGVRKCLTSRYLVGADGALSTVRQKLNGHPVRHYVAIQEYIEHNMWRDDCLCFIYDSQITDAMCWAIPKRDRLLLGCALRPGSFKDRMGIFVSKVREKFAISGRLIKREAGVGLWLEHIEDVDLGAGGVLLVGEAAGLISLSSGDGISFALRSGYNCALALNRDFDDAGSKYRSLCEPLLDELTHKIERSQALSNPLARRAIFPH